MYKYVGYVWPGMLRVSVTEAKKLLKSGADVYRLHLDNTEGAVTDIGEIEENGEYGVECEEFSFDNYLASNQDSSGAVVFSHGTDDVDDLLTLMKEFLECIRPSLRESLQNALDMLLFRKDTTKGDSGIISVAAWAAGEGQDTPDMKKMTNDLKGTFAACVVIVRKKEKDGRLYTNYDLKYLIRPPKEKAS